MQRRHARAEALGHANTLLHGFFGKFSAVGRQQNMLVHGVLLESRGRIGRDSTLTATEWRALIHVKRAAEAGFAAQSRAHGAWTHDVPGIGIPAQIARRPRASA